jgi:2'-5' RNA ligase
MRTFIAVELDAILKNALGKLQKTLREQLAKQYNPDCNGMKWTRPEQIHLTLKFLGEVEDRDIMAVCRGVDAVTARCDPFDVEFGSVGTFPPGKPARVLWAGLTTRCDPLLTLQKKMEDQMAELGFVPENRGFQGHLTLARINNTRLGSICREVAEPSVLTVLGTQSVDTVTVFRSDLTRQGPIYTAMHHSPLGRG